MTKATRTRQLIIEKTAPLFNMNGFEATSLAELCRVTELTKGALYGNFRDKEELASEAFRYTVSQMRSHGSSFMRSGKTYKRKLQGLLDFFLSAVLNPPVAGGCPLLNTAVEADDHRIGMKSAVVHELEKSINSMTKLLELGKRAGEFKKDVNSKEMATLFFCAIEGAIMISRVSGTQEVMGIVTKNIRKIVDGMSVKRSPKQRLTDRRKGM